MRIRGGCRLAADERGATAVEYALVASLVAVAAIGGYVAFADSAGRLWETIGAAIVAVLGGS